MNASRFLQGFLIFCLGLLFLATNVGYVPVRVWDGVMALWPVLIVLVGLGLIIKNKYIFAVMGMFIILFSLGAVVYYGPGGMTGTSKDELVSEQTAKFSLDQSDRKLDLTVNTGALALEVTPMTEEEAKGSLIIAEATGMNKISLTNTRGNSEVSTVLKEDSPNNTSTFTTRRRLALRVSPKVDLELVLNVGASKLDLDLSKNKLTSIVFNSGAVSSNLKLGKVEGLQTIDLKAGVSSFQISLPKEAGTLINTKSGLSNLTLPDGKSSVAFEGTYKSDGYDSAKQQINIDIRSGLTNVKISSY